MEIEQGGVGLTHGHYIIGSMVVGHKIRYKT